MAEDQKDYFREWWNLWTLQLERAADLGGVREGGDVAVEGEERPTTPSAPTLSGDS